MGNGIFKEAFTDLRPLAGLDILGFKHETVNEEAELYKKSARRMSLLCLMHLKTQKIRVQEIYCIRTKTGKPTVKGGLFSKAKELKTRKTHFEPRYTLMEPAVGVEPTTIRLQGERSTN
jgi:hypothetical protein